MFSRSFLLNKSALNRSISNFSALRIPKRCFSESVETYQGKSLLSSRQDRNNNSNNQFTFAKKDSVIFLK